MGRRPRVTTASTQFHNETVTTDLEMAQPSDIIMPNDGPIVYENEKIVPIDTPLNKAYLDSLAFAEDVLTVQLMPSSEENAPTLIDVYVNGEAKWVPVGETVNLKRKFVEVLMRSKPVTVNVMTSNVAAWMGEGRPIDNKIMRNQRAKYPMSVMHDPSPKGGEWLRRIMMEL